ncbi:MAG: hypothetical protein CMI55_00125 [Parcubacteria group bacterium]|jgi:hypothetical protein|nr:hypothetical protein [Parcubacteria group bacterium]
MSKELFNRLKQLNLPKGKYAVFGSAPMCIRGLRECRDLDVIVTEDLFNEYSKKEGWETKKTEKSVYLDNNGIEFWKDWGPDWAPEGQWDIQTLIDEAEIIDGLPIVRLKEVLKWKSVLRREKDLKDLKLIEGYLKSNKNMY